MAERLNAIGSWTLTPATPLPEGATLGLFSPSEPLTRQRHATLRESVEILTRQRFKIKFAPNALVQGPYAAGDPGQRIDDIRALAADPQVDALIATWGGKSCNQLLADLDFSFIAQARKPLIGFSDVAVLLNALTSETGLASFHYLVAGRLPETQHPTMELLRGSTAMFSDVFDFHADGLPKHVVRPGVGVGRLFGGNLSTFVLGLLGTRFLSRLPGDIVFFWESASERPQLVDQHLTALRNSGFFDRLRGMIIGSVRSDGEVDIKDIKQAIGYAVGGYDFPILYSPTFGHHRTRNPVVPIGALCQVDADSFSVSLQENAVRR